MDTTILVDELDKSAFKLVQALSDKNFEFTVAALMKNQDAEDWYLVLGIPELHIKGSRDSFAAIYNTIKEEDLNLSLSDIKLLDDRGPNFTLLKQRFKPSSKITRTIFREDYINGINFPNAIIYYVNN
jgi:hypothetical protein